MKHLGYRRVFGLLALLLTATVSAAEAPAPLSVRDLRCEYRQDPLGIDAPQPRLSWILSSKQRGQRQSAYQILVASAGDQLDAGDVWNSGKIASDATLQVPFAGKPLESGRRYFWKVRAWDSLDKPSAWSEPATWTMGLLDARDWQAKWIAARPDDVVAPGGVGAGKPAHGEALPIFRRAFTVAKPVARATIYVSGLGFYELHVNGRKVGDSVLDPGWTNYRKTVLYNTWDVTPFLRQGPNAIGVMLGNGMYRVLAERYHKFTGSFGAPKLIAQLHIEYADGTADTIVSDRDWKTAPGPITFTSIYGGEDYDARRERPGWDDGGFDDADWAPALETTAPGGQLADSSRSAPPIHVAEVLKTRKITQPKPGIWVYDLGQNCAMMPRITVTGTAGATVKLTPGELLNGDGTVSQATSGGPTWCAYTLKGSDAETWSPRFFYYGCRYIQVEGAVPADSPPAGGSPDAKLPVMTDLVGQFITSSAPMVGEFSCSDDMFNRTADIIRWAMRSNMMSVLTDCPHRERLGWLEETHLVGPSIMYNFAAPELFAKISADARDAQLDNGMVPDTAPEYKMFKLGFRDSPEWGSAALLVPWQLYQWYGDTAVLRAQYETMRRYVDYLGSRATGHIVSHGLGDWYDLGPGAHGAAQLTPIALTATAFYYRDIQVLADTAKLLGHSDDADRCASLAREVGEAFNQKFYDRKAHRYATGSQTANAVPLVFGLAPPEDTAAIVENIVQDVRRHDNGLTAGDVGYRYLLRALSDGGRSDVIFDMNSRSDRPGYGYILAKGATSLTEGWDGSDSQDHFMLGHIMEWFYSGLAGIGAEPDAIAFNKIVIRPTPVGDVTSARASYDSPRGRTASSWRLTGGRFTVDVTVPVNTTAVVYLPGKDEATATESGRALGAAEGVAVQSVKNGVIECRVGSGTFHFETTTP